MKNTKNQYLIILLIVLIATFCFWALAIVSYRYFNFHLSSENTILTLVGILATFVVISNYVQVQDIKNEFSIKINEIENNMKEIRDSKQKVEVIKKEIDDERRIKDFSYFFYKESEFNDKYRFKTKRSDGLIQDETDNLYKIIYNKILNTDNPLEKKDVNKLIRKEIREDLYFDKINSKGINKEFKQNIAPIMLSNFKNMDFFKEKLTQHIMVSISLGNKFYP